ncbi:MAG: HAD-IIIA family hydrolase [Clostridia bacterium]|nr:HAD-IIIA family hydrolase [Clostridia bacterium]
MSIKMLVMDVDGTLTDGRIYTGAGGELMKAFNVKDGYAIAHILPDKGIVPVIITGRRSDIVDFRCKELGIKYCYQGVKDKLDTLKSLWAEQGIDADETAYIGDDLNDLECMESCGISACPSDGAEQVKKAANYVCSAKGGEGAVREFIEYILR